MIDVPALLAALGIREEKRSGRRRWARCPRVDHPDRDPSWAIWDEPGARRHASHRCFGCGWHGGPAALVAEVMDVTLGEARGWLRDGGLDVPSDSAEIEVLAPRVPGAGPGEVVLPAGVRWTGWDDWPTVARRYLEHRGFGAATVARWGLGVAPKGPLEGRIVLPVRDHAGRLVSWQARSYVGAEPRYLTATDGARGTMFGPALWTSERGWVVVVEGPFDALAVDRATGGDAVAALLGSDPSPRQLSSLATFGRVIVATDADAAGDKAAAAVAGLARWTRVERVVLPPGSDPADLEDSALRALLS